MAKLPLLTANELSKILKKIGFVVIRQGGSHMFFRHSNGRTTTVPNHGNEEIDRGLLNKIVKNDLQLTREEFLKYVD